MPWPRISTPGTYPIEKCAQMFTKDMHTNVMAALILIAPKCEHPNAYHSRIDKSIMVYSYHGKLNSNKNEQTAVTHNKMGCIS